MRINYYFLLILGVITAGLGYYFWFTPIGKKLSRRYPVKVEPIY